MQYRGMSDKPHYFTFSPEIAIDPNSSLPTGFSGIAYSGGVVPNYGWYGDTAIDLASVTFPERIFALVNHDDEERAGHCRVWLEGDAIRVAGQFSKATEAGQSVAAEFAEGAPWKLSVGFNANVEINDPPRSIDINGRSLIVNAIFRNARILEVSFVPSDADPNTSVSAFSSKDQRQQEPPMADESTRIAALEGQVATLTASLAAEKTRADTAESALADSRKTARLSAVKALFSALDREYDDAKAAPYLEMSDAVFAAVSADLQAAKPARDESLFQQSAKNGKAPDTQPQLNIAEIYAMRAKRNAA